MHRRTELHLPNGHWDRFFDSLVGDRDCIFPEVPRIIHDGADGFTVDQRGQMDLYSNLVLSTTDDFPILDLGFVADSNEAELSVSHDELVTLTKPGYRAEIIDFLSDSIRIRAVAEAIRFREKRLLMLIPAQSDSDSTWNLVLADGFNVIGVGGYGGWEGYVKVRGIFQGVVFVRYMTNLVMLVGQYSPFYSAAAQVASFDAGLTSQYVGCYEDKSPRQLPHFLRDQSDLLMTPTSCLSSCAHLGYEYAGIQNGMECWCGDQIQEDTYKKLADSECMKSQCSSFSGSGKLWTALIGNNDAQMRCGGPWTNAVYRASTEALSGVDFKKLGVTQDMTVIVGDSKQSCKSVCSTRSMECRASLFPAIHKNCNALKEFARCDRCIEENDTELGFSTPSIRSNSECSLSKGRYLRCDWTPKVDFRRICVCV